MTHFGIICLGATGHLNTMFPLGRELQRRGHRITIFSDSNVQSKALEAGFDFRVIGEAMFSPHKYAELMEKQKRLRGLAALRHTINLSKERVAVSLRHTPAAIKEAGVEALLVDMSALEGGTIAEFLNLPFVTVCSMLAFYQEECVPPIFTTWNYNPAWWVRLGNRATYKLINLMAQPIWKVLFEYRRKWNLPAYSSENDIFSKLAIVSQHPALFEFPRRELPPWFYFTGPFHDSTGRQVVDFPFEKLTGAPLIYASMGTLQNRKEFVFRTIASACVGLDAQLVISLGGGLEPEALPNLPGEPLVVKYAPQLELLKRATLTITHAGLNTTLESLSNAVPLVAIPITDDQPGVAARIAWTGTGEFVPLSRLSAPRLRKAIQQVLTEESYKENALRLQEAIRHTGGVSRAGDIIEQAVSTRKPVMSH
ncbi:MAG: glycosyltransferase [Cyanobacteriota bacterium]